jgi:hypothetical protein
MCSFEGCDYGFQYNHEWCSPVSKLCEWHGLLWEFKTRLELAKIEIDEFSFAKHDDSFHADLKHAVFTMLYPEDVKYIRADNSHRPFVLNTRAATKLALLKEESVQWWLEGRLIAD